jgi:serine protease AprX
MQEDFEDIRDWLGSAFARKASDRLRARMRSDANPVDSPAVVIELTDGISEMARASATSADFSPSRLERVSSLKRLFEENTRTLRDELCRIPGAQVEYCWLNQTIYTTAQVNQLSEVANDPLISAFDSPRPIQVERQSLEEPGLFVFVPHLADRRHGSGKGISIGLIDSEVADSHPALIGRITKKSNHTKEKWGHPHWHATAVAGIIGGKSPAIQGLAPESELHSYKVIAAAESSSGNDFHGSLCIQEALEDGLNIVNCSWGDGDIGDGAGRNARACNNAWNLGLLIIKSAGNNGALTSPADAEGIIVVGACDNYASEIPDYSGRGTTLDGRSLPHLVAPGGTPTEGMFSCVPPDKYGADSYGTSFAAPVVTAVAARILEREPQLTPDEVRSRILSLCKPITGNTDLEGKGVVSLVQIVL